MSRRKELALTAGKPIAASFPLARYRSAEISAALPAYLASVTSPGDTILELGTRGATYTRETVAAGRRILTQNINPLPLLWTHIELTPAPFDAVRSALTRLGDLPKGSRPFIHHLRELYASRCPNCGRPGSAAWFAWDREQQRPFAKRVRCSHCKKSQEGPVDQQDLERLSTLPPRSGPAYHIALGRVAASDDPLRERAAELVQLYTPRNLSALMDILHRLPRAAADTETRRALSGLILEAFDRGSKLVPYNSPLTRPRSLKPPAKFLEYNIWDLLENALADYESIASAAASASSPHDSSLQDFLKNEDSAPYLLSAHALHALTKSIPPASLGMLVIHADWPDATFWALSALWATWLWKDGLSPKLRAFIGRRRLDGEWYQRDLLQTLRYARPLLRPDAQVLILTADSETRSITPVLAALRQSEFTLQKWLACPPNGYRLSYTTALQDHKLPANGDGISYEETLQRRGEPTPITLLNSIQLLAEAQSNAKATEINASPTKQINSAVFSHPSKETLWLTTPKKSKKPLADRVEEVVLHLLNTQMRWRRPALEAAIYAHFYGSLSVEPALVDACISAYTVAQDQNYVALRPEDHARTRRAEIRSLRAMLRKLGKRLTFRTTRRLNGDIVWLEQGRPAYMFRCSGSAQLAAPLMTPARPRGAIRRCLVLPGGRAALVALKLHRDPRLANIAQEQGWTFIKFRHLRRMSEEIKQRSEIEVYLGLDPIVEQENAQIPLSLHFT